MTMHSPTSARASPFDTTADAIRDDAHAIAVAKGLALAFTQEAAARDRERRLPWEEVGEFSRSGLWTLTVPKSYGGPQVSFATLAQVIAIISAADPSLGQLPRITLAAWISLSKRRRRPRSASGTVRCSPANDLATPSPNAGHGTCWRSPPAPSPRATATW